MVKELSESLFFLAEKIDSLHSRDGDWWKGYVAGIKRAASMAEVWEAFDESRS